MKNKLGFTLVELLAVIVILAIILVIAIPQIMSTIESSRKSTIELTVKTIASSAEKEYTKRSVLGTLDQDNNPIGCTDVVKLSSRDYESCKITFDNNNRAVVTLLGNGKFKKYKCINTTGTCIEKTSVYEETLLNGAYPRLDDGMIPVTISDTGVVTTVDPTSNTWYSYANKNWANVVLVKETGTQTREYYKTNNNVTVDESDIYAYLVWIPRYRYELFNVGGNGATYSNGSCTANCPQLINITFEDSSTAKSSGTTNGTYLTHPAFTYDSRELNGIWVGKFETTGDATTPTIKPYVGATVVKSLRSQNVSTQFKTSLKFSRESQYGLNMESRMSKNSEWGAVVYLSHSEYGSGTQIRINNSDYITGCGASTEDAASAGSGICQIKYGSGVSSYPQSTTGNITGIFDMSGGAYEYQMGVLEDPDGNARSGYTGMSYTASEAVAAWGETSGNAISELNSGYNGLIYRPAIGSTTHNTYYKTNGINMPSSRYYKLYNSTNWTTNINYLGEALGETRSWYQDYSLFVGTGNPWFMRGGYYSDGTSAGGFLSYYNSGNASSAVSFRLVVS